MRRPHADISIDLFSEPTKQWWNDVIITITQQVIVIEQYHLHKEDHQQLQANSGTASKAGLMWHVLIDRFITSTGAAVAAWARLKRSGPPGPGRIPTFSRRPSRRPWERRRVPCSRTSTQQLPPTTTTTRCRTGVGYGPPRGRGKKKGDQFRIRCPSS